MLQIFEPVLRAEEELREAILHNRITPNSLYDYTLRITGDKKLAAKREAELILQQMSQD